MRKRSIKLAAVPVALALVAGACGSDDDSSSSDDSSEETEGSDAASDEDEGEGDDGGDDEAATSGDFDGAEVTITGPERDDPSIAAIQDTLGAFGEENNISISYAGDADWEANINTQVEGGNPPDISIFPQPGKLAEFAADGAVVALTDEVNATIDEFWDESYQADGATDDTQYGVPVKTDLKSLVWYKPAAFEEAGYEVPETIDDFTALMATMVEDGNTPLCVGIESGQATGWTFTDWTEEMVLRLHGGDVYDQWVNHEIPFNDPQIVEAMQAVVDFWADENVFASGGSIAATNFGDNAIPLSDGQCMMHRQASFFAGFFAEGTAFADPDDPEAIDVFYFPDINGDNPVLTAGTYAAAFNEDPATMAVLNYMATADYAETRQRIQTEELDGGLSGFLSAAQGQDPSVYQPLEQGFLEILNDSELARFDASDLMPADVGAGSFWSEGTSLVNGTIDAQTAADNIEASWPS
ncbi:ABC transporter substrate-binding protein [Ilumatobacter nonamiensis]|uniref:ABC transporter substrate-binding protein n=1 Tax=Ilumatobacter nonamiensis TaxID=467093 RepID=UPI0003484F9E|nr:ABC transporter substrate-binding protein [Ilumatobacter nonamiensis]